jgi:hypothetical protein
VISEEEIKVMKLSETKLRERYYHHGRNQIVSLITCDPIDGACLLVEPFDEFGDIMGGDLFRCESYELQPVTREIWERIYPVSNPDNLAFEETEVLAELEEPKKDIVEMEAATVSVSLEYHQKEMRELEERLRNLGSDYRKISEWAVQAAVMVQNAACVVIDEAMHRFDEVAGVLSLLERCPVEFKFEACKVCAGLSMIPGAAEDDDVMNTPCPSCNVERLKSPVSVTKFFDEKGNVSALRYLMRDGTTIEHGQSPVVTVDEIKGFKVVLGEDPTRFDYLHAIRAVASRSGNKEIFDLADAGMLVPAEKG